MVEKKVYEWLNNSNNVLSTTTTTLSITKSTTTLIDCILILSINGLYISYDQLIQYCNTINEIKQDSNGVGCKRYINDDEYKELSKGLTFKQFQLLDNNLKSLHSIYKNSKLTPQQPQSFISHDSNNNKTKFDCSIFIIVQNNKININNKYNMSTIINTNTNNNNKRIKFNNDNLLQYNQQYTKQYITSQLFNRIWNDMVIRNEIFRHIRLYNIHKKVQIPVNSLSQLSTYKYNQYVESICFEGDDKIELQCNSIPDNITSIEFRSELKHQLTVNMIPQSVKTIEFGDYSNFNQSLDGNWLPLNIESLKILNSEFQQTIKPNQLPSSLTELILHDEYDGFIENNSIPSSVTTLDFKFSSNENRNSLKLNPIPNSITNLKFDYSFNQSIGLYDIPHNVRTLKFKSNFNNNISLNSLPDSLTFLSLGGYDFPDINNNVDNNNNNNILPPNLTSLEFYKFNKIITPNLFLDCNKLTHLCLFKFNQIIQPNVLPVSLTSLVLYNFNQPLNHENIFPPNLTTIKLISFNQPLSSTIQIFPIGIQSITFEYFNQPIPKGYFYKFKNLKLLEFLYYNHDIHSDTFPCSLVRLELFRFDRPLVNDMFKNLISLKTMIFGSFNQLVEPGQLPLNIKLLTLSTSFNKPINPNVLPLKLKVLYICCKSFYQDLSIENCLPPSIKTIFISKSNIKFLNHLNLYLFSKIIKLK